LPKLGKSKQSTWQHGYRTAEPRRPTDPGIAGE
jgi:hypothetical protein